MPKLSGIERPTKSLKLPITKGTVELVTWITQAEDDSIQEAYVGGHTASVNAETGEVNQGDIAFNMDDFYKARDTAALIIVKSWDITDDDEEILEISLENLGRLPADDYDKVNEAIEKFLAERRPSREAKNRRSGSLHKS